MEGAILTEHYGAWLGAIVAHVDRHDLTCAEVDALCGLSDGAFSKIKASGMKKELRAGPYQMFALNFHLGFDTMLVPNLEKMQVMLEKRTKRLRPKGMLGLGLHPRYAKRARDLIIRHTADALRINGAKGGQARTRKLSPAKRRRIAKKAALVRWADVKAAAAGV